MSGIIARGMPHTASSSSDQSSVRRSMSSVRLAFVTSVTWMPPRRPPVRFHTTQVSGVPKSSSPASAAARAPGTLSRIHATFDAEKYVASGRPVTSANRSAPPVRRGELVDPRLGAGVLPDQGVVDRMPGAAVPHHRRLALIGHADARDVARPEVRPATAPPSVTHSTFVQISTGSCSTQPARGHDLLVLALGDRDDGPGRVEDDRPRRRRSLIDGQDVIGHGRLLPRGQHLPACGRRHASVPRTAVRLSR